MQPKEQLVGYTLDKLGNRWGVIKKVDIFMTRWWILPHRTARANGEGKAFVRTHEVIDKSLPWDHILSDNDVGQLPMARLEDITVSQEVENRGVGTLLLKAIIEDCRQRGHTGIEGDLSDTDREHFDKLEYWYPQNGFSIKFYDKAERRRNRGKPGRVWMMFDAKYRDDARHRVAKPRN